MESSLTEKRKLDVATQLDTPPEIATGRPSRYSGFDGQFIGESWRPGRRGKNLKDADPYTGDTIAEIALANMSDLDEAYQAAETAQPGWAESLPETREKVMLRSAEIMQTRHDEIIDWLVREAGSTRIKAEVEWQMLYGITLEAATFCRRLSGRILPINEPGKESRAYRQPIGVIGVISPWNFPIYLAHRTVGPALALGNAVVVKPSHDTPITERAFARQNLRGSRTASRFVERRDWLKQRNWPGVRAARCSRSDLVYRINFRGAANRGSGHDSSTD